MTATTGDNVIGASAGQNQLTGQTGNTVTATTGNNVIGASAGQNQLTGQTGNTVTATTGNNVITATAGSNTLNANAANQSNTISATGANGKNEMIANAANGKNDIEAATNNIGVATANSANNIGNAGTSVNTMAGLTNNLNAATNNIGVTSLVGGATTNNIGTNALASSTNTIGNTNGDTTVEGLASNSAFFIGKDAARMTTVSSHVGGALNNGLNVSDKTASVTVSNQNGTAHGLNVGNTTGSFLIENVTTGAQHGMEIYQDRTVLSGGTNSTTLTLDDSGATFRDTTTGGPARVMGVADGINDFDAVNVRQLRGETRRLDKRIGRANAGIASVAAMASIPPPVPGKRFSIGTGYGNFEGANAFAIGGKAKITENTMASASIGLSDGSPTTGVGVSYSF
jgi:hypothetical protein